MTRPILSSVDTGKILEQIRDTSAPSSRIFPLAKFSETSSLSWPPPSSVAPPQWSFYFSSQFFRTPNRPCSAPRFFLAFNTCRVAAGCYGQLLQLLQLEPDKHDWKYDILLLYIFIIYRRTFYERTTFARAAPCRRDCVDAPLGLIYYHYPTDIERENLSKVQTENQSET